MTSGKQHVTKNIKPDSNLDIIKIYFPNCFDKDGNFNLEKFKKEIKINEINLSKESYSLEWLGKSYVRVLTFEPARTLLKENEEWNKQEENKKSENILIKGDNLEVLKHLVNTYKEKIKMIYIDPPYNTGNDGFVYKDDRKFTIEELAEVASIDEEKAKRILDFVNSKSNSHSAWLTFMYPRLYIARRLLREDGVIFVSIDDNEVAQLRILMDEIFGEESFVGQLIWNKGAGSNSEQIRIEHEYLILYTKNKSCMNLNKKPIDNKKYKLKDERGYYKLENLYRGKPKSKGTVYPIEYNGIKIYPNSGDPSLGRWAWNEENFLWAKKNNLIVIEKIKNKKTSQIRPYAVKYKVYKDYVLDIKNKALIPQKHSSLYSNIIKIKGSAGTDEIEELFLKRVFNNPKPINLIKYITRIACTSNDLVLDFFAGSGTTGDAVMQLNAEDGGSRKFILVQIDEPIDPKKNKTAYDFIKNELGVESPTIFDICKERLVRAARKIKEETINKKIEEKEKELKELEQLLQTDETKEKIEKLKREIENLKNQDLGFKIFETIPIWEDYLSDEKELTEQTTLFDVSKLTEKDLKALLITWKTYDGLPLTEECKEVKLNDYVAYYCGGNLYLLHSNWATESIKALLEKIDIDKDFVVDRVIVFGYNFTSRHLREIEENIRNYSNKKQIEIETVIRF